MVITPATVRAVLGAGDAGALPPAVEAAIAHERRRLGEPPDSAAVTEWIDCLQHLPWDRRSDAPIDLAQARARLDAGHAGLDDAKGRIIEHLAVCRRNPRGAGAVLCLAGPPGVGKTSLAQCVAETLGRGFGALSCGGLRDETDLRGHNRTWKDAQPGRIVRELRRVGSRDPVFVLDELDKIGDRPAGVLLEVLDPAQHARFHDAYVELPFDLSEVLFIATANEVARIPAPLRDRLEVIELPGYTEAEKVAIAQTHLVPAQNRAAGLAAAPVRFTPDACRKIIRDYTSERGIRQLTRCLRTVCRKVAMGLETGDDSLVRERITAGQVAAYLGHPDARRSDGVEHLRAQLDDAALPDAVRVRGRQLLDRLSSLAPDHPDHAYERERLQCLLSLPWTARSEAPGDLARARAILDAGHAAHGAVKERLLDYIAVRLAEPDAPAPLLCLAGPPGVGKTSLAELLAAALGRAGAWVACGSLTATALHGVRHDRPRAHRRGVAPRRRPQSPVRARRDRPPGRRRRRRGPARGPRPGPGRTLPRPLPRRGARPLRGALRGHGDQARVGAADAARAHAGDRAARLHRHGEARHRRRKTVAAAAGAARTESRSGPHRRRGARRRRPRLRPGAGGVGPNRRARRAVRRCGAPPRRRPHARRRPRERRRRQGVRRTTSRAGTGHA